MKYKMVLNLRVNIVTVKDEDDGDEGEIFSI